MTNRVRHLLMSFALAAKWLGVFLLLFYLLGFMRYQDRIEFYETMVSTKEDVSALNSIAASALDDLEFPSAFRSDVSMIGISWIAIGGSEPMAGYLVGRSRDGKNIKRFATLEEFRDWAYSEATSYGWLSFALIVLGVGIESLFFRSRTAT